MISECSYDQYLKNLDKAKEIFQSGPVPLKRAFENNLDGVFEEHKKIVRKINRDTNLIIFYGIGTGLFYEAVRKWLKEDRTRKLLFIEDSCPAFDNFLRSALAHEILSSQQVSFQIVKEDDFLIKKIAWEHVLLRAQIFANPFYLKEKSPKFLELKDKLTSEFYGANLIVGDYSDFGELHFRNVLKNLLSAQELYLCSQLKDKFKGVPALICGGGPSVLKNIRFIQQMQERTVMFAGGAGFNILTKHNIQPNFAVNIDKESPQDRFEQTKHLDIPHFVQLQMSHENFRTISSKKILLPSSGSYPMENVLCEALNISQESFEIGWTVGSAMIALAAYLGCSPIIFSGLDFCYEKDKYPENISQGKPVEVIETTDVFGNSVRSQKDWILAKEWIESFAKEKKEICFINANEGGILIKNIPRKSLQDLLQEKFFTSDQSIISNRINMAMNESNPVSLKEEEVKKAVSQLKESAAACLSLCDEKISKMDSLCLSSNFSFKEFESEIFYSAHLLPLWNIFSFIIERDVITQKNIPDKDIAVFINKVIFYKNLSEKYLNL